MGVLGSLFGGIYFASRGGGKKKDIAPPINAGSKDEEKFIQYVFFLRQFIPDPKFEAGMRFVIR
jgi:ATP synthase subunit K